MYYGLLIINEVNMINLQYKEIEKECNICDKKLKLD